MIGNFSSESLERYRDLLRDLVEHDFGEAYDFTRCVKPSGKVYGTSGRCRLGTEQAKQEEPKVERPRGRLTATKIASLTDKQLKVLSEHPEMHKYQRERLKAEIERRKKENEGTEPKATRAPRKKKEEAPAEVKAPEATRTPRKKKEEGSDSLEAKAQPKKRITDERLKKTFDQAIRNLERIDAKEKELRESGLDWKDQKVKDVNARKMKAIEVVILLRQAYYAVNREEFLKAAGERKRIIDQSDRVYREAKAELEKSGLNQFTLPKDHPIKKKFDEAEQIRDRANGEPKQKLFAAYFGEPLEVSKLVSDGGGKVDPSVPSAVPRGGASPKLKEFLEGSEVVMAFNPRGFSKFVKEGEAKNGFESGTGGIKVGRAKPYLEARRRGEQNVLGLPEDTEPKGRPVYAALEHPDRSKSLQGGSGMQMSNYGGIQVIFDNSVKDRSTFTLGDSLDYASGRKIMASPVRDPANSKRSEGEDRKVQVTFSKEPTHSQNIFVNTPSIDFATMSPAYVEAQIHGGLRSADIKEVRYFRGHEIPAATVRLLQKQGVKITELPPQMRDLKVYPDNPNFKDITAIEPDR